MSARERRGMNCDTEHCGLLDACTDKKQGHGYFHKLYYILWTVLSSRRYVTREIHLKILSLGVKKYKNMDCICTVSQVY